MGIEDKIVFEKTDFDYVNSEALIVIVGITPGNSQLLGERENKNKKEIKLENAFAGKMRKPLIKMLDYIGVNALCSISSCASLWNEDFYKVEMTSLLKDATYIVRKDGNKQMFKDVSRIDKSPKLKKMFNDGFLTDCEKYKNVKLFVACGPGVYDVLKGLHKHGSINVPIIGIAHPSGANAGRIACFLGDKDPLDASYEWCIERAEEAKNIIKTLL